ncbi:MAG: hypothetical protein GF329_05265 [Candidatus Lokiarchaeota archaeon]|nr:hypothetical protein [Candidatus Lokiarchaeota archaeon]MBD3338655.1 hypothetical protein [Candidatus Lokiarchaeota archaeon]
MEFIKNSTTVIAIAKIAAYIPHKVVRLDNRLSLLNEIYLCKKFEMLTIKIIAIKEINIEYLGYEINSTNFNT